MSAQIVLDARDVAHRYLGAAAPALAGVSLTLAAGEILGLLGPNGAGKSTAVAILSTLLRPNGGGSVRICGIDALRHPGRVRALIGCVPQAAALYGTLSVGENLRFIGRLWGLTGEALAERISWCLNFVGLAEAAPRRLATLSGGMRHRASLAAGLLGKPRLLFLDEPTAGLDLTSRRLILRHTAALRDQGTAIIYTTHAMEEAEQICDRVAIVHGGRIFSQGPPAELVAQTAGVTNLAELFVHLTGQSLTPPQALDALE